MVLKKIGHGSGRGQATFHSDGGCVIRAYTCIFFFVFLSLEHAMSMCVMVLGTDSEHKFVFIDYSPAAPMGISADTM